MKLDDTDRAIINALQGGFPIAERPFAEAGHALGIDEDELIRRIAALLEGGVLTRFGPLFNADRFGGAVSLSAMAVPEERFDEVAEIVNGYDEVAHNYARDHALNMWFVTAARSRDRVDAVLAEIAERAGLVVHDMPKRREFAVHLWLEAI